MDRRILDFLGSQRVFSYCSIDKNNKPHCAICLYAFLPEQHALVFSSKATAKHIVTGLINSSVAGTIVPDKLDILNLKGIQFTGRFLGSEYLANDAKTKYYLKYPAALMMEGELWGIQLESIKMTDNSLGFGTKLNWNAITENEREIT